MEEMFATEVRILTDKPVSKDIQDKLWVGISQLLDDMYEDVGDYIIEIDR